MKKFHLLTKFSKDLIQDLLKIASTKKGLTTPNPIVAAAVVKDGKVISLGTHIYAGEKHAEVIALEKAGSLAVGADLYITLEPCTHFGKTPPCVDKIKACGIKRVFYAINDPNPLVKKNIALSILEQAGIQVFYGIYGKKARRVNEVFIKNQIQKKPFVALKAGMSLDGKIALANGESKYITGQKSLKRVHQLRREYDAVLVGVNTVLQDDPELNIRFEPDYSLQVKRVLKKYNLDEKENVDLLINQPKKAHYKIILDANLKTPPEAKIFNTDKVIIFTSLAEVNSEKLKALNKNAQIFYVNTTKYGLNWLEIFAKLFELGIMSVLIEGGQHVFTSAIEAKIVDKVYFFYAPKLILGEGSISVFGGENISKLDQAISLTNMKIQKLGVDFLVVGYI